MQSERSRLQKATSHELFVWVLRVVKSTGAEAAWGRSEAEEAEEGVAVG